MYMRMHNNNNSNNNNNKISGRTKGTPLGKRLASPDRQYWLTLAL